MVRSACVIIIVLTALPVVSAVGALDADGDDLPDAFEPAFCLAEDTSTSADGVCPDSANYQPPPLATCRSSTQTFACANAPHVLLVADSGTALAIGEAYARPIGLPPPQLRLGYLDNALILSVDGAPIASVPVVWPYQLSGDGTNELGFMVTDLAVGKTCPAAASSGTSALQGQARELRCGGDMDEDGEGDLEEINRFSNPLRRGDDDLPISLP